MSDLYEKLHELAVNLSMNDVLKYAQRIHEFRGDDSYALTSFLREVETLFALVATDPGAKQYIYQRIILNKLQAEALHVTRTLGSNASWKEMKEALINNFGIKETYRQLYQDAFAAKNNEIINEKYEYDSEKPVEFSPVHAEKIMLKTFMKNIDVNLASVIINRNLSLLRDAYNLFEREDLIRDELQSELHF